MKTSVLRAYDLWLKVLEHLPSPVLLAIRLAWGAGFFFAGKGKLENLEARTITFANLGIPFPKANLILASTTEMVGGLLLVLGLGGRLVTVPLIFTMLVAFATAERGSFGQAWADKNPDAIVSAAPFPFLIAALVVLAFGPGKLSVDHLIGKTVRGFLGGSQPDARKS